MITDDIFSEIYPLLLEKNIPTQRILRLNYTLETRKTWEPISSTVANTASKIQLFTLNQFDKVVYVDADSIFLQCPDKLFNCPDSAMYDCYDELGFSGLFVCIPQNHPYDYYKYLLENKGGLDGDLLGRLWKPAFSNPDYRINYNWFIHIAELNDEIAFSDIKGVHFCNRMKPWNYTDIQKYVNDVNAQFPFDSNNNRFKVTELYINQYLIPLKQRFDFQ